MKEQGAARVVHRDEKLLITPAFAQERRAVYGACGLFFFFPLQAFFSYGGHVTHKGGACSQVDVERLLRGQAFCQ